MGLRGKNKTYRIKGVSAPNKVADSQKFLCTILFDRPLAKKDYITFSALSGANPNQADPNIEFLQKNSTTYAASVTVTVYRSDSPYANVALTIRRKDISSASPVRLLAVLDGDEEQSAKILFY